MKKGCFLFFLCLLSFTTISAQQKGYKGNMQVIPLGVQQQGDSLYIKINFNLESVKVNSRRSISLIPVLIAPARELKLPEVMIKGRGNYLLSMRERSLMGKSERRMYEQTAPYAILKGFKSKDEKNVLYRTAIAFEPWMENARLDIREDLCGCGAPARSLVDSQLVSRIQMETPYLVTPHLAYVRPATEPFKRRELVGEAFLDFVVAKIDIRPGYLNNPAELEKITRMMEEVKNDPAITVKGISVIGYASPEGTLAFNRYLSEGRAKALKNYLMPRFDYSSELYRVTFGGENWEGLLKVLDTSQLKYKEEVLAILNNKSISDETRKSRLKILHDGEPYRYLVKTYFPYLRKAICKIDYEVKGFDVAEAKEVYKTRPRNLSLNEMYLLANTNEAGSKAFCEIFETAASLFPEDETANLNAATAALSRRDLVSAERYLAKVKSSSAEYDNSMGVLMLLRDQTALAKEFFDKAVKAGSEAGRLNLEELNMKKKSIRQVDSELTE